MENLNYESIEETILNINMINTLTLKEKNDLIQVNIRPKVEDAIQKYSSIPSKCNLEKTLEKAKIEGLKEEDFYMAFYEGENSEINNILLRYIKEQEWFKFFKKSILNFNEAEESNEECYESKYNIQYSICFFILQAKNEIEKHIKSLKNIIITSNVVNKMLDQMANNTLQVYSKTVIYEFHVNKGKYKDEYNNNKLNQYIKDNFVDTNKIIEFYLKYPVLIRRLSVKILNIVNYYKDMLTNINNEYLNMKGDIVSNNIITDISCDMGDTHEGGKFVIKVAFGRDKVIYKPRNLYITKKYYEFINWINSESNLYKLPTIKSIWRDDFTIESCINYETADSEREIERYYTRMGYCVGILYLFNGNDIHYENMIAHKEYPYIIDLETLFAHNSEQLICEGSSIEKIVRIINQSVKGSCLLPSYMFRNSKDKGVDVGGLSGKKAEIPGKRLVLADFNSDNIRFEMQKTYIEDNSNIPMLNGKRVNYENYTDFILVGFNDFMNFIRNNKEIVKSKINEFNDVRTRQVLRATNNYGYMLQFGSHPNYTRQMIYFERMIDSVWSHPYSNKKIASCEFQELVNDDIPVFYCLPTEKSVFSGDGIVIDDLYNESSLETVNKRIDLLSEKEIKVQSNFIKESVGLLENEIQEEKRKLADTIKFKKEVFKEEKEELTSDIINKTFENIYKILDENAVYGEDDVDWIQLINDGFGGKTVSYANANLYDGISGILLYLYYKWTIDGEEKYGDMAKRVASALNNIQGTEGKRVNRDAMFGLCSIIYPVHLYLDAYIDNTTIVMYDAAITWLGKQLDDLNNDNIEISGLASLLILFFNLYDETGDYKYFKVEKKLVNVVRDLGAMYILDKAQSYEIDELSYALELASQVIDEEDILSLKNKILDSYRKEIYKQSYSNGKLIKKNSIDNVTVTPLAATYKIKLYKLTKDEILLSEINKCFKEICNSDEMDIENKLIIIDFLQEYSQVFDSEDAYKMVEKHIVEAIKMYSLDDEEKCKNYDYIIHGIGLNSAVCGIGFRILRYKNISKVKGILDL